MDRKEQIQALEIARAASVREPWERQHRESQKAFVAFREYQRMGAQRSHAKVGRALGKSVNLINRWSRHWDWVRRVQASDDAEDRAVREQHLRAVVEMNERHAELGQVLTGTVVAKLKKVIPKINPKDPGYAEAMRIRERELSRMSLASAARLLEVGVKVERQALGEAGDVGEVVGDRAAEEPPLAHLTTAELEALESIHDAARKRMAQR